jgi:transposase
MRKHLTNGIWDKLAPLLPPKSGRQGPVAKENRLMVEGMLWKMRTSSPWRDLPQEFGLWNSVYTRCSRWCKARVWRGILAALQKQVDWEWIFLDSTIVRAHQYAHGAKKSTPRRSSDRAIARRPADPRSATPSGKHLLLAQAVSWRRNPVRKAPVVLCRRRSHGLHHAVAKKLKTRPRTDALVPKDLCLHSLPQHPL